MKTFLVVASLLMTGASVYGIVDYNKKADTKEFKQLYKENPVENAVVEEKPAAPVVEKKEVLKPDATVKTEVTPKKSATKSDSKKKTPRKLRLKKFSREALG